MCARRGEEVGKCHRSKDDRLAFNGKETWVKVAYNNRPVGNTDGDDIREVVEAVREEDEGFEPNGHTELGQHIDGGERTNNPQSDDL